MSEINQKIKDIISSKDIVLFMKGTPDAPQCGFSMAVSNILKNLNVNLGDTIGTLAWSNLRHFELYYGVSGIGAICHTINPRLFK